MWNAVYTRDGEVVKAGCDTGDEARALLDYIESRMERDDTEYGIVGVERVMRETG